MKRFLIILSFLTIAFSGSSQGDSTIPRRQVINALRAKDSLDIMIKERDSLLLIKSFYEKLDKKDSAIIVANDKLVESKNREIKSLERIEDNLTKQTFDYGLLVSQLKGVIKNKNRTIRKITVGGIAITGTLLYLLIKK